MKMKKKGVAIVADPKPPADPFPWISFGVIALVAIIATIATYWRSLPYEFQFDDLASITKHFNIRHYRLSTLFFSGTRWISYWLNSIYYHYGKFDPWIYRLGNLIIHSLNGLLLFFLFAYGLWAQKKDSFFKKNFLPIAAITAFLFFLHPVQTQTVSYVIQGQLEGLAAFFTLAMMSTFLVRFLAKQSWMKAALTMLLALLAILCTGTKEIAIIAPALIMLYDWFFIAQGNWSALKSRWWIHAMMFLIITSCYLYLLKPSFFTNIIGFKLTAKNNIGNIITQKPDAVITPSLFFISQFKVILHYLWIFIWPFSISVEYDWKLTPSILAPDFIFPFLLVISLLFATLRLLWHNRVNLIAFGALWFTICLGPRSSIIPSPELLVDYKTYLASIGWLFILAAALFWVWDKLVLFFGKIARYWWIPATTLTSLICIATAQRNLIWRSGLEFWDDMIKHAPQKARAYNNYGVELSQRYSKYAESIPYFQKAIAMDHLYPDPCNNLAVAYAGIGKIDDAIEAIKQGLRINPYYPEGYNNLASFLLLKKNYVAAKEALETAIKLRPYYGKAHLNMGRLYAEQGDYQEAWIHFKRCCTQADLDNETGFNAYGRVSLALKKYDDAIFAYQKLLEIAPRDTDGYLNLATAYFMKQNYEQALHYYQKGAKLNPRDIRFIHNIGEAYFALQNYADAWLWFDRAKKAGQQHIGLYARLATCALKINQPEMKTALITELEQKSFADHEKALIQTLITQLKSGQASGITA